MTSSSKTIVEKKDGESKVMKPEPRSLEMGIFTGKTVLPLLCQGARTSHGRS